MAEFKWFPKKPFPFLKANCGIFGTQNEGKQYTILTFFVNIYSNTQYTHSLSLWNSKSKSTLSFLLFLLLNPSNPTLWFISFIHPFSLSLSLPSHAKKKSLSHALKLTKDEFVSISRSFELVLFIKKYIKFQYHQRKYKLKNSISYLIFSWHPNSKNPKFPRKAKSL